MPNENEGRKEGRKEGEQRSRPLMAESNVTHCLSRKDRDGGEGRVSATAMPHCDGGRRKSDRSIEIRELLERERGRGEIPLAWIQFKSAITILP